MFTWKNVSSPFLIALLVVIMLMSTDPVESKPPAGRNPRASAMQTVDNMTYLDANKILMFVTNHGSFGRDLDGVFGNDYGTYYPFTTINNINFGTNISPVIYAGGLWLGGVDNATGDTLVTVTEYSSEYVPGPMSGGTYQEDRSEFQVYRLHRDSLESNSNSDYINWPIDQGAPVDGGGQPEMRGDQLTWAVYNDADHNQHDNNNGNTASMGIEVQQTTWAMDQDGDSEIPLGGGFQITGPAGSGVTVTATGPNPDILNDHDYMVVTDSVEGVFVWHLIDLTLNDTILVAQTEFRGGPIEVDGFSLQVSIESTFASFEVVANGAGPLDPPESAAAPWEEFPVPTEVDPEGYPSDNQQVGEGHWLITTGSAGEGIDRGPYEIFLTRTLRGDEWYAQLSSYDWEMRFTGSNDNPGVGGGYVWAPAFFGLSGASYWVPFELWRTGVNTPDDPSDDLRLIPWIIGDGGDSLYWMSAWGPQDGSGECGPGGCEHEISGGDNDPSTDWVYWCVPTNATPGDAGYQAFETAMITAPQNWSGDEIRVMDRTVLVNWNGDTTTDFTGGATVPSGYNQDLPEIGTVFRMTTIKPVTDLQFTFRAEPYGSLSSGSLGTSIFLKYKLINKGSKSFSNFFMSLWLDPDLGASYDDLVGCDTLTNTFYCYNATNNDPMFAGAPPAVGIKVLEGPIVMSPGDNAYVDGELWPGYKNLDMYSCVTYFNGTDPDNYAESYQYMLGLKAKENGAPYVWNGNILRYQHSGDPVTGVGDLDNTPDDRRIMASFGPFDFRPGDEQYVLFKIGVGQGTDRLSSLTALREVLEYEPVPTAVDNNEPDLLPRKFSVDQNYPNPFNPSTTIAYSLPKRSEVTISIFNVLGQKVMTLDEEIKSAGDHVVVWKGVNESGKSVATGVYFYRVSTGDNVSTKKMLLLK